MKRYLLILLLASLPAWAASGTITTNASSCSVTNTSCLIVPLVQDKGGATLVLSGTWTGTITFEGTGDGGTTWVAINCVPLNSTTPATSTTGNGTWQTNLAGLTGVRMRGSATMTGTANATITPSAASFSNKGTGGSLPNPVTPSAGGTGLDTSASTGVAQVASGTWSVSTALANGTTATTQSAADNSTKVATTAYVDRVTASGQAGNAICWKTATTLSYCTSVVASDGTCTCH